MDYHIIMPLLSLCKRGASYAKSVGLKWFISAGYTQTVFPKLEQQAQLFFIPSSIPNAGYDDLWLFTRFLLF